MVSGSEELNDRIAKKIEKIKDLELEVARREGVAEEKRKGLEIESVESIRLFREASGYLLRIIDLRKHFEAELNTNDHHLERVYGHMDDYNQLLNELQNNNTFQTTVENYEEVSYQRGKGGKVTIGQQFVRLERSYGKSDPNFPAISNFVAPRMIRNTEKLENALIGRCMSGK